MPAEEDAVLECTSDYVVKVGQFLTTGTAGRVYHGSGCDGTPVVVKVVDDR